MADPKTAAPVRSIPRTSIPQLISQARTGRLNRSRLLQILYDVGPTSRADLARIADVAKTTISSIVQPMIDQGMLIELAPRPSGTFGGKPARPVWFSPDGKPVIALHVMPETVRAALVSPTGEIRAIAEGRYSAAEDDHKTILREIERCISTVLPPDGPRPWGIGVAVGGMVDADRGIIVEVNLGRHLSGLPLGPMLSETFGLPVHLDVHSRVQALGDRWFGPGRRVADFISVYCGEAIGAGFVIDGNVHRGRASAGGEVGHAIVDLHGRQCHCGKRGCWETIATRKWLRSRAAELGAADASELTARRLFELPPDDTVRTLIDEYARNISVGLVNLQQTFGTDLFLLHGDVKEGGETFRKQIEEYVVAGTAAHPGVELRVEFSDMEEATLLGATGLVLTQLFDSVG